MKRNIVMLSLSDEQFLAVVKKSTSMSDICRRLGLRVQGSNYKTIRRRMELLKICPIWSSARKRQSWEPLSLDKILVEDSSYGSSDLRCRLIKKGLLKLGCAVCKNTGEWQGKPLTLQLDHINGNHRDNRLENLRILCPNCHTQTETHSGKRLKVISRCSCGQIKSKRANHCVDCSNKRLRNKPKPVADRLPLETIKNEVWQQTPEQLAKKYNCSNNGFIKICKRHGIPLPPSGYWLKRHYGKTHEEALAPKKERCYYRLSPDEISKIETMLSQDKGIREVAREIGRSHATLCRAISRGVIKTT